MSLYLHLDRGEVNERTPSNGRVCSMPAKRSGRYGNTPLRYYSAKSTLVLAFHTGNRRPPSQPGVITAPAVTANQQQHGIITSPTADHHGDGSTFWSSAANGNTNNSSLGPFGFKGTYRFIRKSRTSFGTQSAVFPPVSIRSSIHHCKDETYWEKRNDWANVFFLFPLKKKGPSSFPLSPGFYRSLLVPGHTGKFGRKCRRV